jgi:hypothetical protein
MAERRRFVNHTTAAVGPKRFRNHGMKGRR